MGINHLAMDDDWGYPHGLETSKWANHPQKSSFFIDFMGIGFGGCLKIGFFCSQFLSLQRWLTGGWNGGRCVQLNLNKEDIDFKLGID